MEGKWYWLGGSNANQFSNVPIYLSRIFKDGSICTVEYKYLWVQPS